MHNFYSKLLLQIEILNNTFWKFLIEKTKELSEREFTLSNKTND